jgi:hypothetical protein
MGWDQPHHPAGQMARRKLRGLSQRKVAFLIVRGTF